VRGRPPGSPRRAARVRTTAGAAASERAPLPGSRAARLPKTIEPQLATLVSAPPSGDLWLHELKLDGYRILGRIENGQARLLSRNGHDWTSRVPELARALGRLPVTEAFVDGEVVVVLPDGTTSFNALQNALNNTRTVHVRYVLFDLLHLDGYDLRPVPLEGRKARLRALLGAGKGGGIGAGARPGLAPTADGPLGYSDHVIGEGEEFFRLACRHGLEGIVSKRRRDPYGSGRGRSWVKVKCVKGQEVVIGGFTDPEGSRAGIGALLLGVPEPGAGLRYAGKVGTGFSSAEARRLRERLERLRTLRRPFSSSPPDAAKAHWVEPRLVAEVQFTEWTPDGRLRHPSFKGLREDKDASEVVREAPESRTAVASPESPRGRRAAPTATTRGDDARAGETPGEVRVAGVVLTHPRRVLYPGQGVTKEGLARFYESIADWILPHLRDRPTSLVRCPQGLRRNCFYQKHAGPGVPEAIRRVRIREKTKVGEYLVIDDLPGLIGLVQIGILEIHTWNSRVARLEEPDRLVFDLDPGAGVSWSDVVAAARRVREALQASKLESFVKTSGGKGLHIVAPIQGGADWKRCADFARGVAEALARSEPGAFVASMGKSNRKGRIFLDYLRNVRGGTSVAAYSTRARPGAPVSAPVGWDELDALEGADRVTVDNLPARLASLRRDPWAAYVGTRQRLPEWSA